MYINDFNSLVKIYRYSFIIILYSSMQVQEKKESEKKHSKVPTRLSQHGGPEHNVHSRAGRP